MIAIKESVTHYYDINNHHTPYYFSRELAHILRQEKHRDQEPVFLCIGSDRATGDSLGPLVGHKLIQHSRFRNVVYGTLASPVHAKNLEATLDKIKKAHKRAFIIAVDASLGTNEHIGYISLKSGSLKPGAGVSKTLPAVGHVSITGIVNASGMLDHMLLQTTRLHLVMQLADGICLGLRYTFPSSL